MLISIVVPNSRDFQCLRFAVLSGWEALYRENGCG